MHNQLIYDSFGRKYKLHLQGDGPIPKNIKPATFSDETSTRNFLMRMEVRESYWRQLYYLLSGSIPQADGSPDGLVAIARLFMQGRIQIFPINDVDVKHDSIARRTFKLPDGNTYQFALATEKLINSNKKTKKFASKQDALEFVRKLSLKDDSLQGVVSSLSLPLSSDSVQSDKQEVLSSSLADAIVAENVFVFEDMPNKSAASKVVYEDVQVKPVTLGPEPNEVPIKVTAKIDAEYNVVLFDRQFSKYQDVSEEKVQTDATIIELWLEQDTSSPVFDQGAKIDLSGAGKIQAFIDEQLTTELNLSAVIPADKVIGGNKLKIWVKGKTAGKLNIKLTPSTSTNGRFVIQPPAELEMGVVELKLEVYEQDSVEIAKLQVDPDQEPISQYHTDLESTNLPPQIILSDEDKIKRGRLLHAQDSGNFGRSKIVVKALTAAQFPADDGNCHIAVNTGGKSGALKLFDAEFDGNEIPLPLIIDKADLSADKIYWAEGVDESNALRETRLDIGLGLAGKPSKSNGDWASFTVVKISEVLLEVVTPTGKAEVWDKVKKRFYVNLDGTEDARKLKDKSTQRDVKVKVNLTKKIPDVVVHFFLVPDKRNWDKNHWGANILNFEFSKVERALKQTDKKTYKDLVHLSAKTDANGNAQTQDLVLSRIGGDVFRFGAYLDQDAHLAKYVDGHTTLSLKEPVFSKDSIEVWRKFHVQNTFNKNITLPSRALTKTSFEKCFIDIQEVDEQQYDPITIPGLVEHELWQFDMSGSTRKVVCVGTENKLKFTGLFKTPIDTTKPKAHMVMCDVQWDGEMGNDQDFYFSGLTGSINYKNTAGNSYLGVFDPPLGGGSIVQATSKWAWNDGSRNHQGRLNDTNIAIEKTRGHYSEVKVTIPAVCPASCPCGSPGTAIAPTATKQAIVRVKFKAATGPWAGESGQPGYPHCLIVVNNNLNQFNNTIAHEIGHLFKSVRTDTGWKGIPDHPDQYVKRGGQGSHCKENATEHATRVDQNGDKEYIGGSCVMYHVAVGNTVFCDNCSADIRVRDVSDIFKD